MYAAHNLKAGPDVEPLLSCSSELAVLQYLKNMCCRKGVGVGTLLAPAAQVPGDKARVAQRHAHAERRPRALRGHLLQPVPRVRSFGLTDMNQVLSRACPEGSRCNRGGAPMS